MIQISNNEGRMVRSFSLTLPLFLLTLLLVALKIEGYITISWFMALLPILLVPFCALMALCFIIIVMILAIITDR